MMVHFKANCAFGIYLSISTPIDSPLFHFHLEIVSNMKQVASMGTELSVEERNLLSVGYKNIVGVRRASWRIVTSIEQKEENRGNSENVKLIREYRTKVEEELASICEDILKVLDENLIPTASTSDPQVFYLKM